MNNSACVIFPNEVYKCDVIYGIKLTTSIISFLASSFMLIIIILFKRFNSTSQKLILNLTIAAFTNSLIYIINTPVENRVACSAFGTIQTYTDWALVLAIFFITCNLIVSIQKQSVQQNIHILIYISICWLLPIFPAFLPLSGNHYGNTGPWCWIVPTMWRFGIWFIPWILILITMVIMYIIIIYFLRKMSSNWEGVFMRDNNDARESTFRNELKSLIGYPLAFFLSRILALINRTHNAVSPEDPSFALYILMAIASPLSGAINTLVFGLDSDIQKRLSVARIKVAFATWSQHDLLEDYDVTDNSTDPVHHTDIEDGPTFDNVDLDGINDLAL